MAVTLNTPFGAVRTATRRRFVIVRPRGNDKGAVAVGYSDDKTKAIERARRGSAVGQIAVVDRVTGELVGRNGI